MALPYIQLYIADYLADTAHLTTEEHGAYLLLIFNYWQRGKPLPNNRERLARIARVDNESWTNLERSLKEYFIVSETEWRHPRIDRDLEVVNERLEKQSAAGKAAAEAKKAKKSEKTNESLNESATNRKRIVNESDTNDQRIFNHKDTDTDTDTEIEKKKYQKEKPKPDLALLAEYGIDGNLATDFIRHRKSKEAPITKTALDGFQRESLKAGIPITQAVTISIERNWQGFKAEWIQEVTSAASGSNSRSGAKGVGARINEIMAEEWTNPEADSSVICTIPSNLGG
jgi:uncharacterized protein YdaU (DUF1376 family)